MEAFRDEKTFGPYQLHAKIAEGGMAEVILGTSQQKEFHGQFLAIKRLRPHLNSNRPFVNLLIHEAKIGVLLNHPGIATVYDLGSYKSEFFLTMEYVHGKSLDKIFERIEKAASPRLSVEVATYIVLETLRALAFAHQLKDSKGRDLNIIHRDISPGNILLSYRGEVKLADFGIATAENRLQPNFSNIPLGKLAYMAPEQVVNDPVVRASDIYSLGVVYYQMLSGQLPFHADNANNLYKKVVDGRVTDLRMTGPTISPGLRDIVNKCLNRSSGKRFQSAPELFQVLVDHFNQEYELDFNSKAIRQYYKKKLSEYLRACFEADIVQEIEITQDCLKKGSKRDDFKVTAPQDLKRLADYEKEVGHAQIEATIQEEDLTNEATRHFPLTEDERKRIIKGLPAKDVMDETRKKVEKNSGDANFNLQTIPEYDLAVEDSAVQRISIKDKLKLSSLDKDQKETLKQQVPNLEIASEQDLAAFEQHTFSGKKPAHDPQSTREMSRSEILREFEKVKTNLSTVDEQTVMESDPGSKEKKSKKESVKVPRAHLNRFKSVERTSIVTPRPRPRSKFVWAFVAAAVIAVGAAAYSYKSQTKPMPVVSETRISLASPKELRIFFAGEVSVDVQKKFVASLQEGADSFAGIESLFSSEFKRYRGQDAKLVRFIFQEPQAVSKPLSSDPEITSLIKSDKLFELFEKEGIKIGDALEPAILVYLYAYDPASSQNAAFPDRLMNSNSKTRGLVFAPAHPTKRIIVLENIAREIAFIFGAKNKEDPTTGLAIPPHGLANPKEVPLFPQAHAELTGRDIAINILQERPITSLKDIVIGPQTALELGWIDAGKRDELLK